MCPTRPRVHAPRCTCGHTFGCDQSCKPHPPCGSGSGLRGYLPVSLSDFQDFRVLEIMDILQSKTNSSHLLNPHGGTQLLVRHFPRWLSEEEKESLLSHFGATEVIVLPPRGKVVCIWVFYQYSPKNLYPVGYIGSQDRHYLLVLRDQNGRRSNCMLLHVASKLEKKYYLNQSCSIC